MPPNRDRVPLSQIPEDTNPEGDESSYIDEVYDQILLRIIRGDYLRGAVLTSSRLAEELKVSREILEPRAAALAASRIPADVLRDLDQMADIANPASGVQWQKDARAFDFALHLAIADHCGNLPLRKAIHKCWSYKRLSYEAGLGNPKSLEVGYGEHIAILRALARRDSETASVAMLFHLRSASNLTTEHRIV